MHRTWPLLVLAASTLVSCQRTQVVDGFPPTFVGVGMELRVIDDTPVIVRTLPGGSAEEAGVLADDVLLAIDGKPTEGLSLGDVVMQIRGTPGSQVTLTLERAQHRHIIVVRRRKMTKAGDDYSRKIPAEKHAPGDAPPPEETGTADEPATDVPQPPVKKPPAKITKRKRKKKRKR